MHPRTDSIQSQVAELQARIERLDATVESEDAARRRREAAEPVAAAEQRLVRVVDECSKFILDLAATGDRCARAVGQLEQRLTGWDEVEKRLQTDVLKRFQTLESTIAEEWSALRTLQQEPTRELRERAETLTEICVTTAGSAQTGLERAEARLSMLETDLRQRMDELAAAVHYAVAELREKAELSRADRSPRAPWALDDVARLHDEVRQEGRRSATPSSALALATPIASTPRLDATSSESPTAPGPAIDSMDAQAGPAAVRDAPRRGRASRWVAATALLVMIIVVAGFLTANVYRRVRASEARAASAEESVARIASDSTVRLNEVQRTAAQQIAQARESAAKAQIASDVLAAPDLIRFTLRGGQYVPPAAAQLLWSRTAGFVFSASRLPNAPAGTVYQIWMMTAAGPARLATFQPDSSGRVSMTSDQPTTIRQAVTGAEVTIESPSRAGAPSGAVVLSRPQ